jgi:hypothetical protein
MILYRNIKQIMTEREIGRKKAKTLVNSTMLEIYNYKGDIIGYGDVDSILLEIIEKMKKDRETSKIQEQ